MKKTTYLLIVLVVIALTNTVDAQKIDRYALVSRHSIIHSNIDSLNSLSVGNGHFTYTVDITGMQTFPGFYEKGIPLGTMAEWAWHSFPNTENFTLKDVVKYYKVGSDSVPYYFQIASNPNDRRSQAADWLRANPHRLHLGLIGLKLLKSDLSECSIKDIKNPKQSLNLWTGEITSEFEFEGSPVKIRTICDQQNDRVLVDIESELVRTGKLKIELKFPYARREKFNPAYDLNSPSLHTSQIVELKDNFCLIKRQLDETVYYSRMEWSGKALVTSESQHYFVVSPDKKNKRFKFSVLFSEIIPENKLTDFDKTAVQNQKSWLNFWNSGGAVDFSKCTDPRASELERRLVLSQYLTKIQCTGQYPPQETGLTYNSWFGKFHLEMHWWHALHFILWQRQELIEKQLDYYFKIFENSKQTANLQGYKGVRWPKMTDPSGRESPSFVGVFLIWQEPHFIYFADLLYRSKQNDRKILNKYKQLVFETAEFMASYARFDTVKNKYVLGPAIISAQERFKPESTLNPSFELAYWYWALETAQKWREDAGLKRDSHWQKVIDQLAPLPVSDGKYLFAETAPDSYTNYLTDHPIVLGIMGFIPPTPVVDKTILENSQKAILDTWEWNTCWGWDFPLAAMNATVLDNPELAIDLLLKDCQKNTYLQNGHNYQDESLRLYLPGNGGLLATVAMLCTYRNSHGQNGFPANGKWNVEYENLNSLY